MAQAAFNGQMYDPVQYGFGGGYIPENNSDVYGNPYNTGGITSTLGNVFSHNYTPNLPGGGQGKPFVQERQGQAVATLGSGITNTEGDAAIRDALRAKIQAQIGDFNPGAQNAAANAQYDRGLNNSLATLRRQMGGMGTSGSLQAGRAAGDAVAQSNQARAQGLASLQGTQAQTLQGLGAAESQPLQQSLLERGFTLQQAQDLSNLLMQQSQQEQNSIIGTATQPGPSNLAKGLGYAFSGIGSLGSLGSGLGAMGVKF